MLAPGSTTSAAPEVPATELPGPKPAPRHGPAARRFSLAQLRPNNNNGVATAGVTDASTLSPPIPTTRRVTAAPLAMAIPSRPALPPASLPSASGMPSSSPQQLAAPETEKEQLASGTRFQPDLFGKIPSQDNRQQPALLQLAVANNRKTALDQGGRLMTPPPSYSTSFSSASPGPLLPPELLATASRPPAFESAPPSSSPSRPPSPSKPHYALQKKQPLDLTTRLSRIPFTLLVFFLLFFIFQLNQLAQTVTNDAAVLKSMINETCQSIEVGASTIASIPTYTVEGANSAIASVVNNAIDDGFTAAIEGSQLLIDLLTYLLEFRLRRWLCFADEGVAVFTELANIVASETQQSINQELASYQSQLAQLENQLDSELSLASQQLNTAIDALDFFGDTIPHIPTAPAFPSVPVMNVPTPQVLVVESPSTFVASLLYQYVISGLLDTYLFQSLIEANATRSEHYLGPSTLPVPALIDLTFCNSVDYSPIDQAADGLVTGVYIAIAMSAVVIAVAVVRDLVGEVREHHWEGEAAKANNNNVDLFASQTVARLRRALRYFRLYVSHPPALYCIALCIVGIVTFNLLIFGARRAQSDYESVATQASYAWAATVASQYNAQVNATVDTYVRDVNNVVSNLQDSINGELAQAMQFVQSVDTAASFVASDIQQLVAIVTDNVDPLIITTVEDLISCLLGLDNLPLDRIANLTLPLLSITFPRASTDLLQVNASLIASHVQMLALSVDPLFASFESQCQSTLQFYYLLLCVCLLFLLVGLGASIAVFTGHVEFQPEAVDSVPVPSLPESPTRSAAPPSQALARKRSARVGPSHHHHHHHLFRSSKTVAEWMAEPARPLPVPPSPSAASFNGDGMPMKSPRSLGAGGSSFASTAELRRRTSTVIPIPPELLSSVPSSLNDPDAAFSSSSSASSTLEHSLYLQQQQHLQHQPLQHKRNKSLSIKLT